jgi:cellulose synthase/poly-beta-1,6-N-acetylglucosamine synthase-like glycosyltransferase
MKKNSLTSVKSLHGVQQGEQIKDVDQQPTLAQDVDQQPTLAQDVDQQPTLVQEPTLAQDADQQPTLELLTIQETVVLNTPSLSSSGKQLGTTDPHTQEKVKFYTNWLATQANYDVQRDNSKEIEEYIEEATKVVKVGKREVSIFAPFRPKLSALQTFTAKQVVILCLIGLVGILGLLVFRLEALTFIITAITVMYFCNLILNVIMAFRSFRNTTEERISDDIVHALKEVEWPEYTILCPLYREAQVVPQFVKAMQDLDYPAEKLQILFLTEMDDTETRTAIRALSLPPHFKIVIVPDGKPRTKPRACNYGLMFAKGPYVVIYDAEDIPDPLQLKKAVLTFANHSTDVICVQAKLNFYNIRQNLLTRWFTAEYSTWFDLVLPGLQLAGFSLPLGGTSNHFRSAALRALGGWDAYNVTEDCDLGLRLKRYHMNTVVLDSTTYEEANSQLKNWLRQRSRWIKGYMQTYLVHMRTPLEYFQKGRLYELLSFQVVVGSGVAVLFINPLMWALLAVYIAFGPSVVGFYHHLFPGPVLYLGAFCLICGNFFYIYLYLLACMKRKQYHLLLSTLFIPCYWFLISIAGFYALFELVVKPHYWQKTVHGLHLKGGNQVALVLPPETEKETIAAEETMPILAAQGQVSKIGIIPSITMSLKAIPTLIVPAISPGQKQAQLVAKKAKVRDLWLFATIIISCITSIVACRYYFLNNEILLNPDAHSHLRISRSVFDSLTPGLAQLGSVWLPLPHILMWPFIWNNYLWHSGLAGSFVAMPCYVAAAIYLFLAAKRITRNSAASFVGTLVFIFNPNVLYLQTTPLSETVCMVTFIAACYYFLVWIQEDTLKSLVLTSGCIFLATLARYDGWPLFVALLCFIPLVGLFKHHRFPRIQGNVITFVILGGLGIGLWLIWNKLIFGDPLYFQHGIYSSQAQQMLLVANNTLFSYHNLWQSIRFYTIDSAQSVGSLLLFLLFVALLWFIVENRFKPTTFGVLVFLVPFAFYILALYNGNAVIWLPGANPPGAPVYMYNVRYGAQMVAPTAFCIAILADKLGSIPIPYFKLVTRVLLMAVILTQCVLIQLQGVISLQDGQYNYACSPHHTTLDYLAEHYNGGRILTDVYAIGFDPTDAGSINFRDVVYEGSNPYWSQALRDPAHAVEWILVDPSSKVDLVAQHINVNSPAFLSQFALVAQQTNNIRLYHRLGGPPLPNRPAPVTLQFEHVPCIQGN